MKIRANVISTMQSINILLFDYSLVLKALQLSMVGLSTVKSHTIGRSHLNQKHIKMPIACMSLLTKGVQNDHHLHGHMPETLSPLANCSVDFPVITRKSDYSVCTNVITLNIFARI